MSLQHYFDSPLPDTVWTARGTTLYVRGWCFDPDHDLSSLALDIAGVGSFPLVHGRARPDIRNVYPGGPDQERRTIRAGFYGLIPIPAGITGSRMVALVANDNAGGQRRDLGPLAFTDQAPVANDPPPAASVRVAVCLATYRPKLADLKRQLGSIQAQTLRDFLCIVNEDSPDHPTPELVREATGGDPRFVVARNAKNLGFYHNFERCLMRVPAGVPYIALADQDDWWRPEKLETLAAALSAGGCDLVYHDVRIVDAHGNQIAPTYWTWRRNHWDFERLFFANTVTGAACMFRRELLAPLLPFPMRVGDIFHDWWISINAAARGGIRYLDKPLHDYYQHGANVIGHVDGRPNDPRRGYADRVRHSLAVMDFDVLRLALVARVLAQRGVAMRPATAAAGWGRGLPASALWYRLKGALRHRHTLGAEARIAGAHLHRWGYDFYHLSSPKLRRAARWLLGRAPQTPAPAAPVAAPAPARTPGLDLATMAEFERKISPLHLVVSEREPRRINLVVPQVDFAVLFGGYLGKFRLAEALLKRGHRVRVITVDWCDFKPEAWKAKAKGFLGLERIFADLEFVDGLHRYPLAVHPDDRWIATTWWTAYVVADAVRQMPSRNPFLYLIQEYEPLTFNHGSLYALADASYRAPHFALFSTSQLQDFFRRQRIGVYAEDAVPAAAAPAADFFENAIVPLHCDAAGLKDRPTRRLLMYLRPEAHAARNCFELGYVALRRCVQRGVFARGGWEFHGIGTTSLGTTIPLDGATTMTVLPKMDLDQYRERLPGYDLGISLMLTPHPSLVPIEMCAAGLVTVTTAYANKTAASMHGISSNFIVAEPHLDGVVAAITRAVAAVEDVPARVAGSRVRWPMDWDAAFHPALMDRLDAFLGASPPAAPDPSAASPARIHPTTQEAIS